MDKSKITWRSSDTEFFVSAPYTDKFIHSFASISPASHFDSILNEWRIPKDGMDIEGFGETLKSITESDILTIDRMSKPDRLGVEYGYACVETGEGPESQIDTLRNYGIPDERLYLDRVKSKNSPRPEFDTCLKKISAGDTIVVTRLDKLGLSLRQLAETAYSIRSKGGHFSSVSEDIDTRDIQFRYFVEDIKYASDFESRRISERTKAGQLAAKISGNKMGRPSKMTKEKAKLAVELVLDGKSGSEITDELEFGSQSTFYRNVPYGMVEIRQIFEHEGQDGLDRLIQEISDSLHKSQKIQSNIVLLHKEGATIQMIADKFNFRQPTIQRIIEDSETT